MTPSARKELESMRRWMKKKYGWLWPDQGPGMVRNEIIKVITRRLNAAKKK